MSTLLEITDKVLALQRRLDECDGELPADLEAELDAIFDPSDGELPQKLDGYCVLIQTFSLRAEWREAEAKTMKAEAARIATASKAYRNKETRLRDRLKEYLTKTKQTKISTDRHDIALCGNGGIQKLDYPDDAATLPKEFQRVKADVDAIRTALEEGQVVPGCALLPRGEHVRIS